MDPGAPSPNRSLRTKGPVGRGGVAPLSQPGPSRHTAAAADKVPSACKRGRNKGGTTRNPSSFDGEGFCDLQSFQFRTGTETPRTQRTPTTPRNETEERVLEGQPMATATV